MTEHSDDYILGRLIERSRLLIAISDDIAVETKLQTQPLLKQLEALLAPPADEQDRSRIHATYEQLRRELGENADLEALLGAMRHFLPPP